MDGDFEGGGGGSVAETLPPELQKLALRVQVGDMPHWSGLRAMIRNGLLTRRLGTWVLTSTGLSAASVARSLGGAGQGARAVASIPGLTSGVGSMLSGSSVSGEKGARWISISSTGHLDADGEFVSKKALSGDVERADGDGDFGPLVWWHEYQPLLQDKDTGRDVLYQALVLGHCDFNAMAGPNDEYLVESGTFVSDAIAKAAAANQEKLAVSIKFNYGSKDRGRDGTYSAIRRRERSLLPRSKEANLFTQFLVVGI